MKNIKPRSQRRMLIIIAFVLMQAMLLTQGDFSLAAVPQLRNPAHEVQMPEQRVDAPTAGLSRSHPYIATALFSRTDTSLPVDTFYGMFAAIPLGVAIHAISLQTETRLSLGMPVGVLAPHQVRFAFAGQRLERQAGESAQPAQVCFVPESTGPPQTHRHRVGEEIFSNC